MIMSIVVLIVMLLFVFLGLLHVYWAFGGKIGVNKVIPVIDGKPTMTPGVTITLIVAIVLFGCGAVVFMLGFYDLTSLPQGSLIIYAGWALSGIFIVRAIGDFKVLGFFKKINTTEFSKYDTHYYSPLCLSLGVIFLALSYGQIG